MLALLISHWVHFLFDVKYIMVLVIIARNVSFPNFRANEEMAVTITCYIIEFYGAAVLVDREDTP